MPRTRSQTAALLAQQITELAMGDMTNRITNTSNKKHKTPPNKQNTPKKKKKRRKRGSSLSMRKKPTNTKGRGDGSENNPYTATLRSTKRRIKQMNYTLIMSGFLFISVPLVVYIAYFALSPSNLNSQSGTFIADQKALFNTLLFDVYIYYYQCLSIIFQSKGISVSSWFHIVVLSIFNLQLAPVSSNNAKGVCVVPGVDAFGKLLLNFVYPLSLLIPMIFVAIMQQYTKCYLSQYCCVCIKKKHHRLYRITKYCMRRAYVKRSFIRILLIYIGTAIMTLFQVAK
eukprot:476955_1